MERLPTTGATDFYAALGLHRQVNAWGTITDVGGSIMRPEVVAAMAQAATGYVDVEQLMRRGGDRVADLIGVDAVCFTAGAAAGLVLGSAVLLDHHRARHGSGTRPQVLALAGHVTEYLRAAVPSSADVVELEDTAAAFQDARTALLFVDAGIAEQQGVDLDDVIASARDARIPLLLDAAAELPPKANLTRFHRAGASVVVFSGGKQVRGPQASGLLIASREIVEGCLARSTPHHGVGRAMKIDKETIVGLMCAVELYLHDDEAAEADRCERVVAALTRELWTVPGLQVRRGLGEGAVRPASIPRVYVRPVDRAVEEVRTALQRQSPPVLVGSNGRELVLSPQCLRDEDVAKVIAGVRTALHAPETSPLG